MEKICLDCEVPIKGRTDKKFCDDQCRSNYNNRQKIKTSGAVRIIDAILKRNRQIMVKLNPDGKAKIAKNKLVQAGFNFGYHTHIYETQNNHVYKFCYEYGYLELEKEVFLLIKRNVLE